MSNKTILPCPCCGSQAELYKQGHREYSPTYSVVCRGCGLRTRPYDSEDKAIDHWNTRIDNWIPCSERMPEKTANYLVTTDNHTISMYAWWKRSEKRWFYFNSTVEMFDVIAWKPLPEPYKKEGAE